MQIETCCNIAIDSLSVILFTVSSWSFFRVWNQSSFKGKRYETILAYQVAHTVRKTHARTIDRYICWCVIVSDDYFGPYLDPIGCPDHPSSTLNRRSSTSSIHSPPSPPYASLSLSLYLSTCLALSISLSFPPHRSRASTLFLLLALYLHPSLSVSLHGFERHPTFP